MTDPRAPEDTRLSSDITPEQWEQMATWPRDEWGEMIVPPRIEWRVYYGDGTTADNTTHALADLPAWDCQMIVQHDDKHNRSTPGGKDFYIYNLRDGIWYPADFTGFLDYIANRFEEVGKVLVGRYIPNDEYEEIVKRVAADPDFLPVSAGRGRFA